MNKKLIFAAVLFFMLISLFLNLIGNNKVPPCLNADEAAFGYNSYSLLKTARDEYGAFLPLRLKSFDDFKLPVYSYLSIPFIALFGLNEFSTRFLNMIVGVAFVPLMYLMLKSMFRNEKIALIGAFLTSISTWIHIMSRQAQEGVICAFFILLGIYFLVKFVETKKWLYFFLTNISIFLSTFAYHFGRIFLAFFVLYEIIYFWQHRRKVKRKYVIAGTIMLIAIIVIPLIIDFRYSINRVANLAFYKNPAVTLRVQEYLTEHNFPLLHNVITESFRDVTNRYMEQLSPEFFLVWGDKTWRFGYFNLGVITLTEYVFIFIGLYYFFKNKAPFRFLILSLFFLAPLGNALTWQEYSLIRTYFMIFPLFTIVAYGVFHFFAEIRQTKYFWLILIGVVGLYSFSLVINWDVYLFHYPKRIEVIRAWQCGYKQLVDYVKTNYNNYDRFIITDKLGQPYIFFLYYMKYNPARYQKQAKISVPDEFGFGQIATFDKFYFKFTYSPAAKKTVYVGFPEEFKGLPINMKKIKKIQIRSEQMFWIYEVN